jgi:thiosulfate dehydrogenase (quinone) large subunit
MSENLKSISGESLAFLVLRAWLGLRALGTGIEKYTETLRIQKPLIDPATGMEDPSGAMIEVAQKVYGLSHYKALPPSLATKFANEPLLPDWALSIFSATLGPVLLILGITTLLGVATRTSLFVQGLLYTALMFGMMLINQNDGVAWLGIHTLLVAAALYLCAYNRFMLWKKW